MKKLTLEISERQEEEELNEAISHLQRLVICLYLLWRSLSSMGWEDSNLDDNLADTLVADLADALAAAVDTCFVDAVLQCDADQIGTVFMELSSRTALTWRLGMKTTF